MEHINNIKSHAQTLCPCLIVVPCKTIESLTCVMANFGYHIFYLKNNKTPNKIFGQQQTNVAKTFIQEKIDVNIVMEWGNIIMSKKKKKNKQTHTHTHTHTHLSKPDLRYLHLVHFQIF